MKALPILLLGGAAAYMMTTGGRRKLKGADIWIKSLFEKTGNDAYDLGKRSKEDIIREIQLTLGVEPVTGKWNAATEAAVREVHKDL